MPPNLFTAVRIDDPELLKNLRNVLVKAIEKNYHAKDSITPLEEAHVTITVMEAHDINFARKEFNRICDNHRKELESAKEDIGFKGMDLFGDKVLFANPSEGLNFLRKARTILEQEMIIANKDQIVNFCYRDFNPHLTMFQIKTSNIDGVDLPEIAKEFENYDFGKSKVGSIQLLHMGNRTDDGYWEVLEEFKF